MNERVLSTLEFDKIKQKLKEYAVSDIGKEYVQLLYPQIDTASVEVLLKQTSEAENILARSGQNPIESFPDVRELLKRVHATAALSMSELLLASRCLRVSRVVRDKLLNNEQTGLLAHIASQLCSCRSIEEEITRCILSDEEIADNASAALADIRRDKRIINSRMRDKLNDMIKSASFQKYLQEPIITIRNGRYVIPVKQECRQNVPGLIHDQSGSGVTLFIEPMAVVELGNELKKLEGLENEEIYRILSSLTAELENHAGDLLESIRLLGELDRIFAKAVYAKEINAICPNISHDRQIKIISGRHPLIPLSSVVPVDIWLGDGFKTLIVTGPNTGGKTVTLKTMGLFALMAQAGLFVPAGIGTRLCVFENIYADIGDEQSIEQSLSTFSSHMSNIVGILKSADDRSLILLDELGAGTDPVEGAALAMSILENLHERNCLTAATTHYSEIKAFALMREGMQNASMEFDVENLRPTYRLFIGIPGKSNAFEIAQRLGLNSEIIETAREFLKQENIKFEDVIQNAQEQKRYAEAERQEASEYKLSLENMLKQAELDREKQNKEYAALIKKTKEEARTLFKQSKAEIDTVIAELKTVKSIDRQELDRAAQRARDALRTQEGSLAATEKEAIDNGPAPTSLLPGDSVYIISLQQDAVVLSAPKGKDEAQVQAGRIKLMAKYSDLRKINKVPKKEEAPSTRFILNTPRENLLSLDIRGKLVDEAIVEVDRYIDECLIKGRSELQIIHGKGTGALRTGVQSYLKSHSKVKNFRPGAYGEGDAGVTILELK